LSPNVNYRAGRAFEYKRRTHYKREGYEVIRAAGSHGFYDLMAFHSERPTLCIQCKKVEKRSHANNMLEKFKQNPPLPRSNYFYQRLDVYVKEDREILSITI